MKLRRILLTLLCCMSLLACEDIFERNLQKDDIVVLAPPNNFSTNVITLTFWWQTLKGALNYKLEVVQGTFAYVQKLVLDTTVKGNKVVYTLSPGSYQWRVRAENGSSVTDFITRNLTIDSTGDLSGQTLILTAPNNNLYSTQFIHTMKWDTLYNASDYRVQVAKPDFSLVPNIIYDITTTLDTQNYTFPSEGGYEWRVRGQNASSNTPYTTRVITIDTTAPSAPTLLLPNNGDTATSPVTLLWSSELNASHDTLYVYPDSLISPASKFYLTDTTYNYPNVLGDYFWRVKTIDQAGNSSNYSVLRKFIIQ